MSQSKDRIYRVWYAMRERCRRPSDKAYKNYGGRGIRVCERWSVFENFLADMGPRPPGGTLERINNDGHYEPSNCRWATRREQNRNTRQNHVIEYRGVRRCIAEWAELAGMQESTLRRRMRVQGMTFEQAISTPFRYRKSNNGHAPRGVA